MRIAVVAVVMLLVLHPWARAEAKIPTVACIVQGLLQHLAINFSSTVWTRFRSWLRTMKKKDLVPSEMVVALALKADLPEFLLNDPTDPELKKFILDHVAHDRVPAFKMAA